MADVVAGHVLAMLGKFDVESLIRAFMKTRDEPLHNEAGDELQITETAQRVGVEKAMRHRRGLLHKARGGRYPAPSQVFRQAPSLDKGGEQVKLYNESRAVFYTTRSNAAIESANEGERGSFL